MDPLLQWMLGIYATLTVASVLGMAKFLYGIDLKLGSLDKKLALFMQAAEQRFESHERELANLRDEVYKRK